jgi:hypothetical protein
MNFDGNLTLGPDPACGIVIANLYWHEVTAKGERYEN